MKYLGGLLVAGLTGIVVHAEIVASPVDLSGACDIEHTANALAPLPEGRWRGTVDFAGIPTEFSLDVDEGNGTGARLQLRTSQRTVELSGWSRERDLVAIPIDARFGERIVGRVRGENFTGRYFVGDGVTGAGLDFAFNARREIHADRLRPSKNNLSGEWAFTFGSAAGPANTVYALVGYGAQKLYVIWRNPDGTKRYLIGEHDGSRFLLKEISSGENVLVGRVDSAADELRGELLEGASRVAFTATRRVPQARYASLLR